jgi:hypothetical protein
MVVNLAFINHILLTSILLVPAQVIKHLSAFLGSVLAMPTFTARLVSKQWVSTVL